MYAYQMMYLECIPNLRLMHIIKVVFGNRFVCLSVCDQDSLRTLNDWIELNLETYFYWDTVSLKILYRGVLKFEK